MLYSTVSLHMCDLEPTPPVMQSPQSKGKQWRKVVTQEVSDEKQKRGEEKKGRKLKADWIEINAVTAKTTDWMKIKVILFHRGDARANEAAQQPLIKSQLVSLPLTDKKEAEQAG